MRVRVSRSWEAQGELVPSCFLKNGLICLQVWDIWFICSRNVPGSLLLYLFPRLFSYSACATQASSSSSTPLLLLSLLSVSPTLLPRLPASGPPTLTPWLSRHCFRNTGLILLPSWSPSHPNFSQQWVGNASVDPVPALNSIISLYRPHWTVPADQCSAKLASCAQCLSPSSLPVMPVFCILQPLV